MKNLFGSKGISREARRRVELAIAVAQERLLSTHVDHALELVQLAGDEIPFDTALAVYGRLLRLTDDEARVITTRALATLGARAEDEREAALEEATTEEVAKKRRNQSLISHLRQRVRGRINDELRRWTELEGARAEVALFQAHVENALNFVEILDGERPPGEAIDLYLDALEVRDSVAEVVYYFALARLSDELLPEPRARSGIAPTAAESAESAAEAEARHLRVIENDGG